MKAIVLVCVLVIAMVVELVSGQCTAEQLQKISIYRTLPQETTAKNKYAV